MRFLIIHQLNHATHEAMATEAARIKTLMQQDPAVVQTDAILTGSVLQHTHPAARIQLGKDHAPQIVDPWPASTEQTSSFIMIDVADRAAAVAWAAQWPARGDDSMIEVRAVGCPGGVHCVSGHIPAGIEADGTHFMVIIHEEQQIGEGQAPAQTVLDAMERHNIESVEAGILLAGHGLHPSPDGARVRFKAGQATVVDGPFSESKELIAGYWLIHAPSRLDAISWAQNYPYPLFHRATISVLPVVGLDWPSRTTSLNLSGA